MATIRHRAEGKPDPEGGTPAVLALRGSSWGPLGLGRNAGVHADGDMVALPGE